MFGLPASNVQLHPDVVVNLDLEWLGCFALTSDKLPILGPVAPGVFVAGGYGGHGMPRCFGAARLLVDGWLSPTPATLTDDDRRLMREWSVERFS